MLLNVILVGTTRESHDTTFSNYDLLNPITPINVNCLNQMLKETNYDETERKFLVNGFSEGFDIEYCGPTDRTDESRNLPFREVGNNKVLWDIIMKEVQLKRLAGPYDAPPFDKYIQSPIGLVPKSGGRARLIFHLSYDFKNSYKSVNHYTPKELCSVKYEDVDHAVANTMKWMNSFNGANTIYYVKLDLVSGFRLAPLKKSCYPWLTMMAKEPITKVKKYFVKKNLSFGHSISCSHFQRFSRALKHLVEHYSGKPNSATYLDDFLFISPSRQGCNYLVRTFISICKKLGVSIAHEKTVMATPKITFLGIQMDRERLVLTVPDDKKREALNRPNFLLARRTVTVKQMESLAGLLNFINKVIVPGRVFTRRMYAKFTNLQETKELKKFHHISLDQEFKQDCKMWVRFLINSNDEAIARPYTDIITPLSLDFKMLNFTSDTSANELLGFGSFFNGRWFYGKWESGFIGKYQPSIQFLELYAFCLGTFTWMKEITLIATQESHGKVYLFCDNKPVVDMVNHTTSSCKYCMTLIRLLTLRTMEFNIRIRAKHISSEDNFLSDSLSRLKISQFRTLAKKHKIRIQQDPTAIIDS